MSTETLPPLTATEREAADKILHAVKDLSKPDVERVFKMAEKMVSRGTTKIKGKQAIDWIDATGKVHTVDEQMADFLRTASPEEMRDYREQLKTQEVNIDDRIAGNRAWLKMLKDHRNTIANEIAEAERAATVPVLPGNEPWTFPPGTPRTLTAARENAAQMWAKHHGTPDSFVQRWYRLGFPTFELTGSLASALCMTECRGLRGRDYKLPFAAFAIQMPSPGPLVLPTGDVRFMLIDGRGDVLAFAGDDGGANPVIAEPADEEDIDAWTRRNVWPAMARFVVNLCVYINSLHALPPPEGRRKPTANAPKKRDHEPPTPQRWVLGREIKLSNGMMQAARSVTVPGATAKARAAYRMHARFMVRGHWRNQACGKKHAERKLRWIEPFWKGPEMADGLARLYALAGEPKK